MWQTLAGQPTDDSELGLALARSLVRMRPYDPEDAAAAYGRWYASEPFDCGHTTGLAFGAGGVGGGVTRPGLLAATPTGAARATDR